MTRWFVFTKTSSKLFELSDYFLNFALCTKSTTSLLCSTSFNGWVCLNLLAIIAIVCSEWFTCVGCGLRSFWCSGIGVALSVLGCCSHLYLFAGFSLKQTRASHVEHRLCLWVWALAERRGARGGLGDECGISPLLQVSFGFVFSQPPTQIETRSVCIHSTQLRPLDSRGANTECPEVVCDIFAAFTFPSF